MTILPSIRNSQFAIRNWLPIRNSQFAIRNWLPIRNSQFAIRNFSTGFTLVELLVVVGMIAVIMGALSTSVSGARARARIVKATADVKEMTNAILSYENYSVGGAHRIPTMDEDANDKKLAFILGKGPSADNGEPVPVLYNATLSAGGKILDPWGTPYKVKIEETTQSEVESDVGNATFVTGYALPNFNRLKEGERP